MNASINQKILTTLAGMLVLLVIASAVGLLGVNRLGDTIRFISNQAWSAADGAMEGTIGLQQELLAVNRYLQGESGTDALASELDQARALADDAFGRMTASGLMPDALAAEAAAAIQRFRQLSDTVVAARGRFVEQRARATALIAEIDGILEAAEEAVETNMDAGRISQQTDVDALWAFADGLMETRIMLLNGQRLFDAAARGGELTESVLAEIAEAERHAADQVAVIAASPFARPPASGRSQSLAQDITQLFASYRGAFASALNSYSDYRLQVQTLTVETAKLLDTIEVLEATGDSQVEGVLAEVDGIIGQAVLTIVITLLIAVGVVVLAMIVMRRTVLKPLQQAVDRMRDIAAGDGDLTVTLPEDGKDELAQLGHWFNQFLGQLRTLVSEITTSLETLNGAAQTLATVSTQTDRTVDQQSGETSSVAAAMTEMSTTVQDVARNATSTAEATHAAEDHARRGDEVVRETVLAIEALAERVDRTAQVIQGLNEDSTAIGSVVDVIRSVAEQTNLLALNAAIEAARAGEQGRGFAVVADEVRTLAGRTQQSTTEIQAMIEKLQGGTEQAVTLMHESHAQVEQTVTQARAAGEALQAITQSSQQVRDMSAQIATASEQQAAVSEDVSRSVSRIQGVTEQTAQGTAEIQRAATELSKMAERLEQMVVKFKT